ncbi:MAG: HYR domain-containing protein [Saprospirales bacterium]|nr:HYR domain-containing protein [Saprospirales bacterium]
MVSDACGNTGTCTQTITVLDTQPPVFVNCPANITVGNDVDKCGANVVFSTPIAEDNCLVVTVAQTVGLVSGSLFPVGTTAITFLATDAAGNTAICAFTITVMDMQAPTAVCKDLTVNLNAAGTATVTAVQIGGGSTDNCPAALSLSLSQTAFDCSHVGVNSVALTVTDAAGNTAVCNAIILVRDLLPPTFTCPNAQTVNGCDGLVPDLVSLVTNAADNCGVASIVQNPVAGSDFGNANGQSVNVTITVTDVNGNVATCVVPVTIVDNVPPVFVNCPTEMIMIGNDVDQCSGKLNWSIPVATDNCVLFSVVQINGPASGTVVPVGQSQTVTYRAFDAAGNSSTCSFQIQVADTQIPELDDDVVMPSDLTVECDAVPAPFVLTNGDVHDNCTASDLLDIDTSEVRTNGNCPNNYVLTRTWTITDAAGNQRVHVQKITVRDTTKPLAICKNASVTLDKSGSVSITTADVDGGSTDNCTSTANLTLIVTPSVFTCANVGENTVILTVTDQCGNSSSCTAIVTVSEGIGSCTPQFTVTTTCMNNATAAGNDGQFLDVITVKALAGQTWTLSANAGLYSVGSPAPPAAPTPLGAGMVLLMGSNDGLDNDGDTETDESDEMIYYTLKGLHVEALGYAITLANNLNQTGTISNKGYYPNPYFVNLYDPFCIETPPFTIEVGEYNNAQGAVTQILVNGVPTSTFDAAALGLGFHTVTAVFDAGSATTNLVINGQLVGGTDAQAQADPGCQQVITKIVQIVTTPTTIVCNDLVQVSLDADCVVDINPDDVLEGTYACFDDYYVELTYPFGTNTYNPPNRVDATHAGKTLNYTLKHALTGNICWGQIKVEDKLAPALDCPADITIACSEPTEIAHTGNVAIDDCSTTTTQLDDEVTDNGECGDPRQIIVRTFIVTDKWGNQAACSQTITVTPFDLSDLVFPADVTINCENVYLNPAATKPNATGRPSINGAPIGQGTLCSASIGYTDVVLDICEGSYEIYRTWLIGNTCIPPGSGNPVSYIQRIRVRDFGGPQFACPGDVTVSVNPVGACCATAALPSMIVSEGCSQIRNLEAKVTGIDPNTGNVTTFTVNGHLGDFPGNNYWNPDTLAIFPTTQCLPIGTYTVRYTAEDGCDNTSSCEFKLTVADLVPPVAACDEFTQVALGVNGEALVNASTFDDGSYDNCAPVHFKARRMNDNDCQDHEYFLDQVKFCCSDINDTVTVIFRVYDIPVAAGAVAEDFGEGHYNDCMVQVFVEDKIKPVCEAPATATVTCENFDPSLWAYGFATATDNCCIDTITSTVNYGSFDTLCNRGTITRTFRAFDCAGQSSQCTQRVYVTYEQDYYIKFPNDQIVSVCDGTGNYGEPLFFGEDCELLGVSYEDEVFTVVPDACFKIERTWTIINWCTYNPNAGCIEVPNPNPNAITNHPTNLPGPTVSACGTPAPWNPTSVKINPTDPQPTNFCTFWDANANCYTYKQIIKVIDTQDPVVENCPDSTVTVCDLTANAGELWNDGAWWDNATGSHDLCEAPTDLNITATDLCSDANINFEFLLFLDLNGDGNMETVVSSTNPPAAGVVNFDNAQNPNFTGGIVTPFDQRPVLSNQKYLFSIQETVSGTKRTASLRWNTQQSPATYAVPELPYGTHKIKWIVSDGCGNETVCEYTFVVKDCKAPTVVCINGLSVNIMPTKMITLWDVDFLQYTEDNCTPSPLLVTAIRKSGTGTGFPTNPDGTPQKSVTFTCDELGTQLVELWSMDLAGNADYCETYAIVQDNMGVCTPGDDASVAGFLKTEVDNGLEDANVELHGMHPALPPVSLFNLSDQNGIYGFPNALPFGSDYTVTPTKDNDPLNGVSTFDLVLINKHILGLEPLSSPYKMIAADANNSRSITTFDIVELRKLILGIYTEFPNNTSWRFVDKDYSFPNPINPFQELFPETKSVAEVQASHFADDFVAVKTGDVNLNAVTSSLVQASDRTEGELLFDVDDRAVKAGETFTLTFRAAEKVKGYQFTLYFPNLEVVEVTPGAGMTLGNFGIFNSERSLTTSFNNDPEASVHGEFAVTFRAKKSGRIFEMLNVSSRITRAEAYGLNAGGADKMDVALRFNGVGGPVVSGLGFELYQNNPNPWTHRTQIGFYLPEATEATLTVYDETGRILFGETGDFAKGYNAFTLDKALLGATGMLYYKVETPADSAVKKMVQTK